RSRTRCGARGAARACTCRKRGATGWCCAHRAARGAAPDASCACRWPRARCAWGCRSPRVVREPPAGGPRGRSSGHGGRASRRRRLRHEGVCMRYAERMGRITSSASFDMLARGKALEAKGRSIIHLGIGEPDFDTPANICRAAEVALAEGYTHYGPPAGLPSFRALIATTWKTTRGIPCGAANVVVTPGAKPILFFAMLATLEPGDEVLIPSPAFPTYASVAEFLGARVVPVPLLPERGFDVDLNALRERLTSRSRMLILNSPHNPTGGVLPRATLQALAVHVRERDMWVLSDEIYAQMSYDGESPSIATLPGMAE